MRSNDYMTHSEIRLQLETKAREIAISLGDRSTIQIDNGGDDEVGVAVEAAVRDQSAMYKKSQMTTLREIRLALDRIQDESYGVCMECEEPIKPRRLEVLPWARYCVPCQEARDLAVKRGVALPDAEPELEVA